MLLPSTTQNTARVCPRCGLTFSSERLDGLCPACLIANTLDAEVPEDGPAFWEDPPEKKAAPARTFSHFELLDELGRGGMGVVYRARDLNTERIVALKVLQAHHLDVPDLVLRFRSEVRAVSSLDHPYVLPIHEVGENEGIPFFSMKLTTGGSLAHSIGVYLGKPREAAQLLAKVARGVQHAHERGILHRDLKPGNILIDAAGEPYVCDFGLAKWIEDDQKLTVTAAVLGTPHYIAPEQALGSKALTTAVDIYSLGAILYELLTGRPPFVGGTVLETLVASQEKSPDRPSSLAKNVPADLETICLKALEHSPAARYATAGAFADDLENYIAGRPITARPVNAAEQLWRWAKRNPLPALLGLLLVLTLFTIAIGSTLAALRIEKERNRAVSAEIAANEDLNRALVAQAKASRLSGRARQRVDALNAISQAAKIHVSLDARNEAIAALTLMDLDETDRRRIRDNSSLRSAIGADLNELALADEKGNIHVKSLRSNSDTILPGTHFVTALLHSGTKYIAARYEDAIVRIWDLKTGEICLELNSTPTESRSFAAFAFDPREERFAICGDESDIYIYNLNDRRLSDVIHSEKPMKAVAFSEHGDVAAISAREPYELAVSSNTGTQKLLLPFRPNALTWDPMGENLAIGGADANIYIIDPHLLSIRSTLTGHRQTISQLTYNHNGLMLLSTGQDRTIRLWDMTTLSEKVILPEAGNDPLMRFSRDDSLIATTDQTDLLLLKVVGMNQVCTTLPSKMRSKDPATLVSSMAYSPDSRFLATASFNGVSIWDAHHKSYIRQVNEEYNVEKTVRFLDNDRLLIACRSGILSVLVKDKTEPIPWPALSEKGFILGSSNRASPSFGVFTGEDQGIVSVVDLNFSGELFRINTGRGVWDAVVNSELSWVACSYTPGAASGVRVFDRKSKKSIEIPAGQGSTLTLNPSGNILITTGEGGPAAWNTSNWTRIASLPAAGRAAFSPDGKILAVCAAVSIVLLVAPDWKPVASLQTNDQHLSSSYRLCFSPDGRQLAAQSYDNNLQLWDLTLLRQQLREIGLDWN